MSQHHGGPRWFRRATFAATNAHGHTIGLDLGATAVRAAILSLSVRDDRPFLTMHARGQVPLPAGAVVNGVVIDSSAVTAALKELWRTEKFGFRNVVLGVTNQQVVVRDLQMPVLPDDQLARALPFKAREIIALPLDQAIIDFLPLGEPNPANGAQDGLLIAAPRAPVLAAVRAVEHAGLRVASVDLCSFGALRSIADPDLAVEAVIDMGAHLTDIIIHDHGVPRVVRTITQGGDLLTAKLADRLELSLGDATRAKVEHGMTGPRGDVVRCLTEAVHPLLTEIRGTTHYFSSTRRGAQVERISLTGGAAQLGGFAAALAELTGLPVGLVAPMEHIQHEWGATSSPPEADGGGATAVALGLAMGAA